MSAPKTKAGDSSVSFFKDRPQRLFFALWPEDSLRQQLVSLCKPVMQASSGRPVSTENLHITLAFLGDVDARQLACIERMAEDIVSPSFELTLDHFGCWSRSRALWFAPSVVPEPLSLLVDALSTGASECGLSLDGRTYRPHVTLMRKVGRAPENRPAESMVWPVSHFVLVRSTSVPLGVEYEVVGEWPLWASAED